MQNIERPKCDFLKSKTISFDTSRLSRIVFRDHIKGLKLRHFGKLNFTYHGKLRHRSRRGAAVHEGEEESLVYCGLCIAAATYINRSTQAAVHERLLPCSLRPVQCGTSAVGVDASQFESFYTVPCFSSK